jgi:hypothetical protein
MVAHVDTLPSVELLERTHEFPGRYVFKVIGLCEDGFVARTVALVRDQLEEERDPPFRVRHTANGRHVAVTLEPNVRSAWEVIAVYQAIRGLAGLEMVF